MLRMSAVLLTSAGDRGDPKPCASISKSLPVADTVTVATHTYAVAVIPPTTPGAPDCPQHQPNNTSKSTNPVSLARNKVAQQQCNQRLLGSSPIEIELELTSRPDPNFVINLLCTLREGACIGYLGLHSPRVSSNFISAAQLPDLVSLNLHKEIALKRVAGPYPSLP